MTTAVKKRMVISSPLHGLFEEFFSNDSFYGFYGYKKPLILDSICALKTAVLESF